MSSAAEPFLRDAYFLPVPDEITADARKVKTFSRPAPRNG
jgi:hypothetical protein